MVHTADGEQVFVGLAAEALIVEVVQVDVGVAAADHAGGGLACSALVFGEPPIAPGEPARGRSCRRHTWHGAATWTPSTPTLAAARASSVLTLSVLIAVAQDVQHSRFHGQIPGHTRPIDHLGRSGWPVSR